MPAATATKTTWVTGRNVPVPRRCSWNGRWSAATAARCSSICAEVVRRVVDLGRAEQGQVGRDQGGHRVAGRRPVLVQLRAPRFGNADRDADAYGPPTPPVRAGATRCGSARRKPTRSYTLRRVTDGDGTGLLGTDPEQLVQLRRVVEVAPGALLDRRDEVGHHLGQVLLQVAVPLALVRRDQVVDRCARTAPE